MKQTTLSIAFGLITTFSFAQKRSKYIENQPGTLEVEFKNTNHKVEVETFIKEEFQDYHTNSRHQLVLDTAITSLTATHYRYSQYIDGKPVINAFLNIHVSENKTTYQSHLAQTNWEITTNNFGSWIIESDKLVGVDKQVETDELGIEIINYSNHADVNYSWANAALKKRATAQGYVFLPDPITSAETSYGGNFVDNNDNTNASLDAERVLVSLDVSENSGTYYLENNFVRIAEHSAPTVAPVTSTTGDFFYDRSESGFEDVNGFYHITEYQNYIQSLGFTNLVNYQLPIDVHGFNGQDQSAFQSSPSMLTFGEGGVDDAEDADVIIHEYGHAISHSAAPNTNIGLDRRAIDEGLGDYLAVSYSRLHNEHEWYNMFSWDGHNEFWNGRIANSNMHYPDDLSSNDYYYNAPLWSSTLMDLEELIGRDVTHILLFESMYSWFFDMDMKEAAGLIIHTDSLLYGGANYYELADVFVTRGLYDTLSTGITDFKNQNQLVNITFQNPSGLSNSQLSIESKVLGDVNIYDISGKLVLQDKFNTGISTITFQPKNSGLYIIYISGDEIKPTTYKWSITQ